MASTAPALKQDRIVFACGPTEYSVRDVIDAAHFRGEVERLWRELLRRLAAEQKAREQGSEIDGSAVDEAAVAFRYQYDLITAEETEAWLEARALNLADFSEYFARAYWADTLGGRLAVDDVAWTDASVEQRELLATELILSGEFDRMAMRLGWRIAARVAAQNPLDPAAVEAERGSFLERAGIEAAEMGDWLAALERDAAWLDELLTAEAFFRRRCGKLLTPDACAREVSSLRLPLTRIEVEVIEFESRHAANEALMCVRDDGMSMEEVAREGRYPYRRSEMVLEEIAVEVQQQYLSLTPGSLLGPTAREDGFILSRLIAKHEPKADDAAVHARIERRILERHFTDLSSNHLQWRILPAIPSE
jgi:hypothetical protein